MNVQASPVFWFAAKRKVEIYSNYTESEIPE